ncbi:clostridium epsilon toxin mosquitocidal toxin MTX2 domain-containing protein [Ditylenchus destructor]|uniref:Clostridium epsilon toxin mosquitocidal toxin MTX2 domain-containing protein n=1 Tax=Ditylenchus destructor TaxID=166010 RepID=A0AAD4R1Z0_9BILA|nr:clostridium epsilon toxin mosquitocidal toxin MTX2 domain-containing protein [Ditylenchus destructor]
MNAFVDTFTGINQEWRSNSQDSISSESRIDSLENQFEILDMPHLVISKFFLTHLPLKSRAISPENIPVGVSGKAPPQPRGSAAATGSAAGTGHAAATGPAAATGRAADTGKKYHTLHDPMSPYMTSRDVMSDSYHIETVMAPNLKPPALPSTAAAIDKHVDVDELLEDYAWKMFKDLAGLKKTSNLDQFKHMEKEEAAFTLNRKRLILVHDDPIYGNVQQTGQRPSTIFKSVFTNNSSDAQQFSLKTERTSESICGVSREQGYAFGAEAELTLKTPCEIAELKTGFKYETHFNSLAENIQSETLTWGIDNNIMVPAGGQIEASVVIEEMSYSGHYTLVSSLSGMVTVNITRARDGVLVLPVSFNVATAFQQYLAKSEPRLKGVVSTDHGKVKLTSKGTCHFQFALKQYVELNDVKDRKQAASPKQTFLGTTVNTGGSSAIGGTAPTAGGYATPYPLAPSGVTATAPSSEMSRMNLQGYNSRPPN